MCMIYTVRSLKHAISNIIRGKDRVFLNVLVDNEHNTADIVLHSAKISHAKHSEYIYGLTKKHFLLNLYTSVFYEILRWWDKKKAVVLAGRLIVIPRKALEHELDVVERELFIYEEKKLKGGMEGKKIGER